MTHLTARRLRLAGLICAAALAACRGERTDRQEHAERREDARSGEARRDPDGKVHEVHMYTNEKGNYFEPREITAKRGDVIKFELKLGVHNVNFLADSNPGKRNLPKTSDYLQLPGQTHEVVVDLEPGKYYFQCDPHAALGMTGHLTVLPR
jgi:plastocyanin